MNNLEKDHEVEEMEELNNRDIEENDKESVNIEYAEPKVYEPSVGMLFDSDLEMFSFYKAYGKQKGFPVKRRSSKKGSDGIVRYVQYACSRSGQSRSKCSNALRPQPNSQIGCNARLGGCLAEDGKWVVRTLILVHNHELHPGMAHYFSCNRTISSNVKRRIAIKDHAGTKVAQNVNSIGVEVDGFQNDSYIERGVRNSVDNESQLRLGEEDIIAIQKFLSRMQSECNGFFFSIDLDKEGRLKNLFWADPRSRATYKDFGDIVTFDTTYLTNKYNMSLTSFVGVNHHGQSILLGSGLISHENTETFTWLFRTWLSCMSESFPIGIITDQDQAMRKAIEIVFPKTRHRWCLWHVLKNVSEKLRGNKQGDTIISLLQNVVYDSQSPIVFEESWNEMILKNDLSCNNWLADLYHERHLWVPCYLKSDFWAGISTTQRSESMSVFFDGYVNSKTTLKQFLEQYDNALRGKIEKEFQADSKSFSQQIPCVTIFPMERQVQEKYTIFKFQEFQQELVGMMYCDILSCVGSLYVVSEENGDSKKNFEVTFEKNEGEIRCSCSSFEFGGILCRHAIAVLVRNSIRLLPEKYIIQRWRKDVRRYHTKQKFSYNVGSLTTEQVRYEKIYDAFAEIADMAADNAESYKFVWDVIQKTKNDLSNKICFRVNEAIVAGQGSCSNNEGSTRSETESIHNSIPSHGKGRMPSRKKEATSVEVPMYSQLQPPQTSFVSPSLIPHRESQHGNFH